MCTTICVNVKWRFCFALEINNNGNKNCVRIEKQYYRVKVLNVSKCTFYVLDRRQPAIGEGTADFNLI